MTSPHPSDRPARLRLRYDPARDAVAEVPARARRDAWRPISEWVRPKEVEAVAVDPSEIPQVKAYDRALGLGDIEYNPQTGSPRFTSPGQYAAYLKAYGYVNRSSVLKGRLPSPSELRRAEEAVRRRYGPNHCVKCANRAEQKERGRRPADPSRKGRPGRQA